MQPDTFEFSVQPKDEVIVYRQFFGKTAKDTDIERIPIPTSPIWLWLIVAAVRFYQKKISGKMGNRCVFDPSCSHYSEIAFRKKGMIRGTILTIKRLHRCRSENGGTDEVI